MFVKLLLVISAILLAHVALGSAELEVTYSGDAEVTINGETYAPTENSNTFAVTVLSTRHLTKVFKPGLGDTNVTVNYGDEDVVYAGPDVEMVLPGRFPPGSVMYVVKFIDGPVVLVYFVDSTGGYSMGGINMPPWGGDYYKTAQKLHKDYLKTL